MWEINCTYTDVVNILGDNIDTIKKTQKLELMLVSRLIYKQTRGK
jgi:hypothetical protein